ncbi:MAG: hypothetical protein ACE14L_12840 [Terriglobales bacterium]
MSSKTFQTYRVLLPLVNPWSHRTVAISGSACDGVFCGALNAFAERAVNLLLGAVRQFLARASPQEFFELLKIAGGFCDYAKPFEASAPNIGSVAGADLRRLYLMPDNSEGIQPWRRAITQQRLPFTP